MLSIVWMNTTSQLRQFEWCFNFLFLRPSLLLSPRWRLPPWFASSFVELLAPPPLYPSIADIQQDYWGLWSNPDVGVEDCANEYRAIVDRGEEPLYNHPTSCEWDPCYWRLYQRGDALVRISVVQFLMPLETIELPSSSHPPNRGDRVRHSPNSFGREHTVKKSSSLQDQHSNNGRQRKWERSERDSNRQESDNWQWEREESKQIRMWLQSFVHLFAYRNVYSHIMLTLILDYWDKWDMMCASLQLIPYTPSMPIHTI